MNLSEILMGNPPTKENLLLYIGMLSGQKTALEFIKDSIGPAGFCAHFDIGEVDSAIEIIESKLRECQFALFLIEGKYVKTKIPSGEEQ